MALLTVHDLRSDKAVLHGERGEWLLRPISDRPLLRHIAGFEINVQWAVRWQPTAAERVCYWFDSWPQPWMGLTVAEELAFARDQLPDGVQEALTNWQLDDLSMDTPLLHVTHFEAVRVMLTRAELSGCDLLLMEQPDAALSDDEMNTLGTLLQSWLQRSNAMAMITTNRAWCREQRVAGTNFKSLGG
ncbi:MAG: hypothetical protein R8J85_08870 [Mariprofundales bacterium]